MLVPNLRRDPRIWNRITRQIAINGNLTKQIPRCNSFQDLNTLPRQERIKKFPGMHDWGWFNKYSGVRDNPKKTSNYC